MSVWLCLCVCVQSSVELLLVRLWLDCISVLFVVGISLLTRGTATLLFALYPLATHAIKHTFFFYFCSLVIWSALCSKQQLHISAICLFIVFWKKKTRANCKYRDNTYKYKHKIKTVDLMANGFKAKYNDWRFFCVAYIKFRMGLRICSVEFER